MRTKLLAGLVALPLFVAVGAAQPSPLKFKQERDGALVTVLSAAEFETLGDPLFQLLLKSTADVTKLGAIEAAIQPNAAKRQLFVVHERIVSQSKTGAFRRAVVAFSGKNGDENLQGNAMLSVGFDPNGNTPEDIEAWGWDNLRGRYNYYKLDGQGAAGGLTWKFRGSSENADLLSPAERKGTCMRCHTTGAPVMKELLFPWNNWHSDFAGAFSATYLQPNSTNPNKWPAAATPRFQQIGGAETLETNFIIPSFQRFNESRVNALLLREDATGNRLVTNGRLTLTGVNRLLRPLFTPTEVNLVSSRHPSGLPPFATARAFVPTSKIEIPGQFFLNTPLIADALKLTAANEFRTFGTLTQAENKVLVEKSQVQFGGVTGDAHFAWIVPASGFIDTAMVDRLLKLGVVTPHFAAAALAVDLENPLFSKDRASLWKFLPERVEFTVLADGTDPTTVPRVPADDRLTLAVLAKIDVANPGEGTPADVF
ncbi:MAG: hypothetical protein ACRC7O_10645, partial [Fimbriiglobus sp.]